MVLSAGAAALAMAGRAPLAPPPVENSRWTLKPTLVLKNATSMSTSSDAVPAIFFSSMYQSSSRSSSIESDTIPRNSSEPWSFTKPESSVPAVPS